MPPDSIQGTRFMKKKFSFWIVNIFLTGVISLLLNGGIFAGDTEVTPLIKEGMGTIKLLGKRPGVQFRNKSLIDHHPFREHFGRDNQISAQQKEER